MSKIKAISVANVRGVRRSVSLALNGRGLLLRGDNGTGKSSLVQALSLALAGRVPSAVQELPAEFVRHRKATDRAKSVVVDLLPAGRIELRGDDVEADPKGQAFLNACKHASVFLRRDELLRVVSQEPTERLRYFEGFLELGHVDELERGLTSRRNELKQHIKGRERQIGERLSSAERSLGAPLSSSRDLLSYAIGRARECGLAVEKSSSWPEVCEVVKQTAAASAMTDGQRARLVSDNATAGELQPPSAPKRAVSALQSAGKSAQESDLLGLLRRIPLPPQARTGYVASILAALPAATVAHAIALARAHSRGELPALKGSVTASNLSELAAAYVVALESGEHAEPLPSHESWTAPAEIVAPPKWPPADLDDTLPIPIRVPGALLTALEPDSTTGVDARALSETLARGPLPFAGNTSAPPAHEVAPRVDSGTAFLDRGEPPAKMRTVMIREASPPPVTLSRATVAIDPSQLPAAAAPFTLAPSKAPHAPSIPFQQVPLPQYARIVVALERGRDAAAILTAHGFDLKGWTTVSRDVFQRSMQDPAFAEELQKALTRARTGTP